MSDKIQATARGLKHTLETIMSKMGNKKRKVTTEIPIDQYLAPDLKDSLFGKLTEDLMFKILCCVSRNYVFLLPVDCIDYICKYVVYSVDDLSQMSMASKALGKVIYVYTMGEPFAMRVARLLMHHPTSNQLIFEHVLFIIQ